LVTFRRTRVSGDSIYMCVYSPLKSNVTCMKTSTWFRLWRLRMQNIGMGVSHLVSSLNSVKYCALSVGKKVKFRIMYNNMLQQLKSTPFWHFAWCWLLVHYDMLGKMLQCQIQRSSSPIKNGSAQYIHTVSVVPGRQETLWGLIKLLCIITLL
jgi:hypothetical protein